MPSAPSPGKLFVLAAGLFLVILLSGTVALVASLFGGDDGDGATATPAASRTTSPAATATATGSPTASPTPDATGLPETLLPTPPEDVSTPTETSSSSSPDENVDPTAFRPLPSEPWNTHDIDFGFVTRARLRGDELQLTVNRAQFLGGQEAVDANGGVIPDNDYLVVDSSGRTRTFTVSPDAVLLGTDVLGSDEDPTTSEVITPTQLRTRITAALSQGRQPMVWLRHARAADRDSPVTYLQEQYAP